MSFVSDAISRFAPRRMLQQHAAVAGRVDDPRRRLRHRGGVRECARERDEQEEQGDEPRGARGGTIVGDHDEPWPTGRARSARDDVAPGARAAATAPGRTRLVLLDASAAAAVIGALKQADTFASFSSALFDESRTLADALDRAVGGNGACAAARRRSTCSCAPGRWPGSARRTSRRSPPRAGFPRPDLAVRGPPGRCSTSASGRRSRSAIGILEKADLAALAAAACCSRCSCSRSTPTTRS